MSVCCRMPLAPVADPADLVGLYQALADPTRLRLLAMLAGVPAPGDEVCVCDLHGSLGVSQPTVSRHLAYLKRAGLVSARRDGVWMHYRLVRPSDPVVAGVFDAAIHALTHVTTTHADRAKLAHAAGLDASA